MRHLVDGRDVESEVIVYTGSDVWCRIDGLTLSSFYVVYVDTVNQYDHRFDGVHSHIATSSRVSDTTNVCV
jgi:hypothetical protein